MSDGENSTCGHRGGLTLDRCCRLYHICLLCLEANTYSSNEAFQIQFCFNRTEQSA